MTPRISPLRRCETASSRVLVRTVKHRTARRLRTALLVPLVAAAGVGLALAVAGGDLGVLAVRVGFVTTTAAVMAGALRWSVVPSASPAVVAGAVALWVLALHGAAPLGGAAVLGVSLAVLGLVVVRHARPAPAPVRLPDRPAQAAGISGRPTPDLCRLWTDTGTEIARATTPDRVARLLEVREAVLEELERRDPEGVRRWLDSAPPATASPLPYVREQHEPPHQAA